MIQIVNVEHRLDDKGHITALNIKLKAIEAGSSNEQHQAAFDNISIVLFKVIHLLGSLTRYRMTPNPRRKNIMNVSLGGFSDEISFDNVAKFLAAFKKALSNA